MHGGSFLSLQPSELYGWRPTPCRGLSLFYGPKPPELGGEWWGLLREGATTGQKRPKIARKNGSSHHCGQHPPGPTRLA